MLITLKKKAKEGRNAFVFIRNNFYILELFWGHILCYISFKNIQKTRNIQGMTQLLSVDSVYILPCLKINVNSI